MQNTRLYRDNNNDYIKMMPKHNLKECIYNSLFTHLLWMVEL